MPSLSVRARCADCDNGWAACLNDGEEFYVSKQLSRSGTSWTAWAAATASAAACIYGLTHYEDKQQALEFAVAASCLKHSILGDFNRVDVSEVEKLMGGDGTGRVQR